MSPPRTVDELTRMLQHEPDNPVYLTQLASRLGQQGRIDEALKTIGSALEHPDCPAIAHQIHGDLLRSAGRPEEASGAYAQAVRTDPSQVDPLFRMGLSLEESNVPDGARQAFEQVLRREPEHEGALLGIARLLGQFKHHPDAIQWLRRTPVLEKSAELQTLLSMELLAAGEYAECSKFLNRHPQLLKNSPFAASLRIRALTYDPQIDAKTLYDETVKWAGTFCPTRSKPAAPLNPDLNRQLRIGFVSSRLNTHNSAIHLHNLLKHTLREQFKIILFSDTPRLDAFSQSLRTLADEWYDITPLRCEEAAELIKNKQIDILIDQHEHSNDNRLQIFGFRPAPLQIHWYANAATTGLDALDFRISSAIADPEEADPFSAEKVIRLRNYYLYSPAPLALNTEPSRHTPAKKNGFITLGAIHHLSKYNDEVLAAWKTILERLPTARLLIGRNDFLSAGTTAAFKNRLAQRGLPLERIELEGDQSVIGSLRIFNRMDIVLDSWPYNGVAATADGLWMGVPHITLYGSRTAGRRAADQLTLAGHPEWIAQTKTEYIEKVIELAGNPERLETIRAVLHDEFAQCPMCDHARTAREIFDTFRTLWQNLCVSG